MNGRLGITPTVRQVRRAQERGDVRVRKRGRHSAQWLEMDGTAQAGRMPKSFKVAEVGKLRGQGVSFLKNDSIRMQTTLHTAQGRVEGGWATEATCMKLGAGLQAEAEVRSSPNDSRRNPVLLAYIRWLCCP